MITRRQAATARRIEADNYGWVVLWAPYRRMFTAFGMWPSDEPILVEATDPNSLLTLMRLHEAPFRTRTTKPVEPGHTNRAGALISR